MLMIKLMVELFRIQNNDLSKNNNPQKLKALSVFFFESCF